jgi:hypothetical protein
MIHRYHPQAQARRARTWNIKGADEGWSMTDLCLAQTREYWEDPDGGAFIPLSAPDWPSEILAEYGEDTARLTLLTAPSATAGAKAEPDPALLESAFRWLGQVDENLRRPSPQGLRGSIRGRGFWPGGKPATIWCAAIGPIRLSPPSKRHSRPLPSLLTPLAPASFSGSNC